MIQRLSLPQPCKHATGHGCAPQLVVQPIPWHRSAIHQCNHNLSDPNAWHSFVTKMRCLQSTGKIRVRGPTPLADTGNFRTRLTDRICTGMQCAQDSIELTRTNEQGPGDQRVDRLRRLSSRLAVRLCALPSRCDGRVFRFDAYLRVTVRTRPLVGILGG